MGAWLLALFIAQVSDQELDAATLACERDYRTCRARDDLRARAASEQAALVAKREAEERIESERQLREVQLAAEKEAHEEEQRVQAMQRKCGKDFARIRVGMLFKRIAECSPESIEMVSEDLRGAVYRHPDGFVRVERGRVVRWVVR